jgi:hypothetical protein
MPLRFGPKRSPSGTVDSRLFREFGARTPLLVLERWRPWWFPTSTQPDRPASCWSPCRSSGAISTRRPPRIPMAMPEAIYVDAVEEKRVVGIRPKPAFRPVFQVAMPREGSGVILIQQAPQSVEGEGLANPCSWWRRGRVELPVQQAPSGISSRRSRRTFLACSTPIGGVRSGQPNSVFGLHPSASDPAAP